MEIIFRKKYVKYNQISDVDLVSIHNLMIDNNISVELGDGFSNDWVSYAYYYCKTHDELDNICISSFAYVISWFMTGNGIDIMDFKSDYYYKNDKIVIACLEILDEIIDKYDSEVDICKDFFMCVYKFYLENHEKYIKLTERVNFLVSYKELELLDAIVGKNRSEKIRVLLDNYYNSQEETQI